MAIKKILLLGNPKLYQPSREVTQTEAQTLQPLVQDLHDTMMDFRERYGAGRAIAAPQIGVMKRIIYMQINEPTVLINPQLVDLSEEMMEVWDDCMSFPDLLVKVKRHCSCRIIYRDIDWQECSMELGADMAELLQHEYDHLNGVLAVQLAVDKHSFALRSQRELIQAVNS